MRIEAVEFFVDTHFLRQIVIKSAYSFLDGQYGWLKRSILTTTWDLWLPAFCNEIELKYGPIQSVSSIAYYDEDGALQTLASSNYEVLAGEFVGKIVKAADTVWPTPAALVPRPRVNLTRFHGVFAPNSRHRAQVTPARPMAFT